MKILGMIQQKIQSRNARIFLAISATWLLVSTFFYVAALGRSSEILVMSELAPFPIGQLWLIMAKAEIFPFEYEYHYREMPGQFFKQNIGSTAHFDFLGWAISSIGPLIPIAILYAVWVWAMKKP